jgi:Ca2+-binding RTX toxin-like protein
VNQAGKAVTLTGSNRNQPAPILPSTTDTDTDGSLTAASQSMGTEDEVTLLSTSAVEMLINPSEASQLSSTTPTKISVSNPTVSERSGRANFVVSRSGDLNQYTWVDYYTQDGDAKAGDRYTPVAGQLVFAPGESSKTVTVLIPNNGKYVGTRQFGLVAQLEGESTDASLVPDAWQAAIATPSEQVRRWKLVPGEDGNSSVTMNVTSTKSANRIVTVDLDLDGTVIPQVWNHNTNSYQNLPFNTTNGIIEFQDISGNMVNDLYRIRFQDGGAFDGDGLNNGLVALNFEFAQLKDVAVPLGGGRIEGTEDNNYINAQNSTGTNRLEGQGGMDVLIGSPQRDVLLGGEGNDLLMGGANIDQLYGGAGDDLLDGGLGTNFLYGDVGADSFLLRRGDGTHRVMDFNPAEGDFFLLENLSMSQLGFSGNQIKLGTNTLAIVIDSFGKPVANFAANPSWFSTVLS